MARTDVDEKPLTEARLASPMVKCDVCGRHYNQRYLTSHKRLSHNAKTDPSVSVDDSRAVEMILALYKKISAKARTDLRHRLSDAEDEA
ncbi:MAG TPA: hypothetical protein VEJ38_15755 [Candidatus Acidoferrales bacterium]|nr:hypothetical protein [Candidatus Acidoferrales bacterium]